VLLEAEAEALVVVAEVDTVEVADMEAAEEVTVEEAVAMEVNRSAAIRKAVEDSLMAAKAARATVPVDMPAARGTSHRAVTRVSQSRVDIKDSNSNSREGISRAVDISMVC